MGRWLAPSWGPSLPEFVHRARSQDLRVLWFQANPILMLRDQSFTLGGELSLRLSLWWPLLPIDAHDHHQAGPAEPYTVFQLRLTRSFLPTTYGSALPQVVPKLSRKSSQAQTASGHRENPRLPT